jgi:hypothetical protein
MKTRHTARNAIVALVLVLGAPRAEAAQTVFSLPFSNSPAVNLTDLRNHVLSNQPTVYTSVSNNDAKLFRGVFIPDSASSKLAIHSDDGSTVSLDGVPKVSKRGVNTQLPNGNSFDEIGVAFAAGQEVCVEIDYLNGLTNVNDRDGVTLHAFDGGGAVADRPIVRGGQDALCVGLTLTLTAHCGTAPFAWTSSPPALVTLAPSGDGSSVVVTGTGSGTVTVGVRDADGKAWSVTFHVVQPGLSPGAFTNCAGVPVTFVLTNSAGTNLPIWSPVGTLSGAGRVNQVTFTNAGNAMVSATYAGCSTLATGVIAAAASLSADVPALCNAGTVIYTATTTPPGYEHLLAWSGEGLTGSGARRTNTYSTPGVKVVSVSCGTSVQQASNVVYRIEITPETQAALADGPVALTYVLTNSFGDATWDINPSGGPTINGGGGGSVSVSAGPNPGRFTLTACADALPSCCDTATLDVVKVTFSPALVAVCEGGSAPLSVTVTPTNYLGQLAFDTVTNLAVGQANTHASITATGANLLVHGLAAGTATVRVRLGASVTFGPTVKIVRVGFPGDAWYVPVGGSATFGVTLAPADAPVTYASANPVVATVTGSGTNVTVTGVGPGTTQVRALAGGAVCAMKDVTVVRAIFMPDPLDVCQGQNAPFTLMVEPPGVSMTVTIANSNVASLAGGTVFGVAAGVTVLEARLNGVLYDAAAVCCYRVTFLTNEFFVAEGHVNTLAVEVEPNVLRSRLTYLSANPSVAAVSGEAPLLTVRGLTNGATQIEVWNGTNQLCATKGVSVVRPAIVSVEWRNLDGSPLTNVNPNAGGGMRIFADRPTPTSPVENRVRIRARISPAVPMLGGVYFQVYDVDDSSSNIAPLDDETIGFDNKGMWTQLPLAGVNADTNGIAETVFTVSMQPGDNFRAVATISNGFFNGIAAIQDDGINARLTNTAHGALVPAANVSGLLTVWRRLHVEVDSMAAVTNNQVTGSITAISGNATAATNLALSVNLRTGLTPPDNSPNLSAGTGNGRFENGWIRVGAVAAQSGVNGNGDTFVSNAGGFSLPAEIVFGGNTVNAGQAVSLAGSVFGVSAGLGAVNYAGGTLRVAGTTFTITANSASNVTVSGTPVLPFVLHDDDNDTLLPRDPDISDLSRAFQVPRCFPWRKVV